MRKHYLITGGAGFIGSHTAIWLAQQDHRVVVLDNFNDYYDPAIKRDNLVPLAYSPQSTVIEGDIRDAALMDQIARDPAAFSKEYQLEAMAQTAVDLQQRVEDMLNSANISRDEAQRAYYFLGAYRGLLAAFRRAVEAVVQIDWQRLQEARF